MKPKYIKPITCICCGHIITDPKAKYCPRCNFCLTCF